MREKKRARLSVIETNASEEADPLHVGDDEVARIVETALLPLRSRLSRAQLDTIRSVLRSSIETDPVLRVLAPRALQTSTPNMRFRAK
jgi:hypothetical protein